MAEYLGVDSKVWLDKVVANKNLMDDMNSINALSKMTDISSRFSKITEELNSKAKKDAWISWWYFWVWDKWDKNVEAIVSEYDNKLKEIVAKFKESWEKDVDGLLASLDMILASINGWSIKEQLASNKKEEFWEKFVWNIKTRNAMLEQAAKNI